MRITTQMLDQSMAKNGLTMSHSALLNILSNDNSSSISSLLSESSTNKSSAAALVQKSSYTKLQEAAGSLNQYASSLLSTEKDSLFQKAKESGDTSEIVSTVQKLAQSYNDSLSELQSAGGTLNQFYQQQLKEMTAASADSLKGLGITQKEDGSLAVDEKTLKSASLTDLEAVFGGSSEFMKNLQYAASHVQDNAEANLKNISSLYGSNGTSYSGGFETGKYDYMG